MDFIIEHLRKEPSSGIDFGVTGKSGMDLSSYNIPCTTGQQIEYFENKLAQDNCFRKELVSYLISFFKQIFAYIYIVYFQLIKLSEIGGRSDKLSLNETSKLGLKIAQTLFSMDLLGNYTWTGKSKMSKTTQKKILKFDKIHNVFFDVIKCACYDYSYTQNDFFFKYNLLKHSKLRLNRNIEK